MTRTYTYNSSYVSHSTKEHMEYEEHATCNLTNHLRWLTHSALGCIMKYYPVLFLELFIKFSAIHKTLGWLSHWGLCFHMTKHLVKVYDLIREAGDNRDNSPPTVTLPQCRQHWSGHHHGLATVSSASRKLCLSDGIKFSAGNEKNYLWVSLNKRLHRKATGW